jgi:hypothetical protein
MRHKIEFENQRQEALRSQDVQTSSDASIYGNMDVENGVQIEFDCNNDQGMGVTPNLSFNDDATSASVGFKVRVGVGMFANPVNLRAGIVHEGEHMTNARSYVSTLSYNGREIYAEEYWLTQFDTEINAYLMTNRVLIEARSPILTFTSSVDKSIMMSLGDPTKSNDEVRQIIRNYLIAAPEYLNILSHKQINWP